MTENEKSKGAAVVVQHMLEKGATTAEVRGYLDALDSPDDGLASERRYGTTILAEAPTVESLPLPGQFKAGTTAEQLADLMMEGGSGESVQAEMAGELPIPGGASLSLEAVQHQAVVAKLAGAQYSGQLAGELPVPGA